MKNCDEQDDHVMTPEEAAALSGPPNYPKIPVKSCRSKDDVPALVSNESILPRVTVERDLSNLKRINENP